MDAHGNTACRSRLPRSRTRLGWRTRGRRTWPGACNRPAWLVRCSASTRRTHGRPARLSRRRAHPRAIGNARQSRGQGIDLWRRLRSGNRSGCKPEHASGRWSEPRPKSRPLQHPPVLTNHAFKQQSIATAQCTGSAGSSWSAHRSNHRFRNAHLRRGLIANATCTAAGN
jgi:hypothetical protein